MTHNYRRIGRAGGRDNGCAPRWNPVDIEHLKTLRIAGLSLSEMAAETGRTRGAVAGQIARSFGKLDQRQRRARLIKGAKLAHELMAKHRAGATQ